MSDKKYYDKKLAEIPNDVLFKAVEVVSHLMTPEDIAAIKADYEEKKEDWIIGHHHGWGMWIRNQLRSAGLKDDLLPDQNWDDYYTQVVEIVVGIRPMPDFKD